MHERELTLPSGLWEDGTCRRQVRLRPLTGYDEEWTRELAPSTSLPDYTTGILGRCVLSLSADAARPTHPGRAPMVPTLPATATTDGDVDALTLGDRDFLLWQLYQMTFGTRLSLLLVCPHCLEKMDLDLNLDELPLERKPSHATYRATLVRAGAALDQNAADQAATDDFAPIEVTFRLPSGADQAHLAAELARPQPLADATLGGERLDDIAGRKLLLSRCLVTPSVLPSWAFAPLADAMEGAASRLETDLDVYCPHCDRSFDRMLDFGEILLGEVRRGEAAQSHEIHVLAFHYHWSRHELLSLTRNERRRHVAVLAAELGQFERGRT